jgi:hypothetical protein
LEEKELTHAEAQGTQRKEDIRHDEQDQHDLNVTQQPPAEAGGLK